MCNLSQGIKEDGIAIGKAIGEAKKETKIIINMYNNGFTIEQIAVATNKGSKEIEAIIKNQEPVLA